MTIFGLIPFGAAPVHASAETQDDLRQWFYIDAVAGIELTGQAALDMLGDMDEVLLELEAGQSGQPEAPGDQIMFFAAPNMGLDMTVYDVLKFKTLSGWTMDGGVPVISSAYEAAAYYMHSIMNGTGWRETQASWGDVYYITFKLDADANVPNNRAGSIIGEIIYFVYAYFPHYFFAGSGSTGRKGEDGGAYLDTITILIGHQNGAATRHWAAEYKEVTELMTRDVGTYLDSGQTSISGGDDDAQKLKNAHDYLAKTVVYNLNAPFNQEAYSALLGEDGSVCNGYALSYSMLCLRMGLDVPYMTGDVLGPGGGAHAWNLNLTGYPGDVLLTDTTWGRVNNTAAVRYDYYNKPLDSFRKDRSWSSYYESYIDYVHGKTDDLNPGMIFSEMSASLIVPSNGVPAINLETETIDLGGMTVAAYSVDGRKWKAGGLPSGDGFKKLFNKELTLLLASSYENRTPGGVVTFPTIKARPKANEDKLAPFYGDSAWVLAKKADPTGAAVYDGYEYANTTDKKNPSGAWMELPAGGIPIGEGKTKTTYLIRKAPSASDCRPGGKIFKVTPANYAAAPKYKIDYKKETLKLKKGDMYHSGTSFTPVTEQKGVELDVAGLITGGGALTVMKGATGKKPRSETQAIAPAPRAPLEPKDLACSGGKITASLNDYEILNPSTGKWGKLPAVTADIELDVRLKATAKATSSGLTGNAASRTGKLALTYGTDATGKTGILTASISGA